VDCPPRMRLLLILAPLFIGACTLSLFRSPFGPPTPLVGTTVAPATETPPIQGSSPTPLTEDQPPTSTPQASLPFCEDPRPLKLLDEFKDAIRSANGEDLAATVSPQHGMDARLLRDGRVVNYDRAHAAALFDSTYVVDWGTAPGSGLPVTGSFKQVVLPDLVAVFSTQHVQQCNQLVVGGTTYTPRWPYDGMDFYSLHYAGSAEYGKMDWHTWVIGIHTVEDLPYVYAIMQFKWEP
jgi:hypothetical protein